MPFKKGNSGNPEGRPKGAVNKSTEELRQVVQSFIDNNIEGMQESFDQLEPKEKLMFIEKMLQYVLPKMQSVQPEGEGFDNQLIVEIVDGSEREV